MGLNERLIEGFPKLSLGSQAFLRSIYEQYSVPLGKIADYTDLLLFPRKIEPAIQTSISSLKDYQVTDRTAQNPRIHRAWAAMGEFVQTIQEELRRKQILFCVYGSMIFDDPRNLDYDVLLVTSRYRQDLDFGQQSMEWDRQLRDEFWNPNKIGHEGSIAYSSLDILRSTASLVSRAGPEYIVENLDRLTITRACDAGIILSAYLFWSPDKPDRNSSNESETLKRIQKEIWGLVRKSPLFGIMLLEQLDECIDERKRRRLKENI